MRRPLFAVLAVLVAATCAPGHSAARGSRSGQTPTTASRTKGPVQKLESVNACMRYRQQRLVEEGGLRMELRNCCHGPVKCAISWAVRCASDSKAETKSADLEISAGTTESAYGYGTACGNDGWRISDVRWNCESVKAGEAARDDI